MVDSSIWPFNSIAARIGAKNYIILGIACPEDVFKFDPLYLEVIVDDSEIELLPVVKDSPEFSILKISLANYLSEAPRFFGVDFFSRIDNHE